MGGVVKNLKKYVSDENRNMKPIDMRTAMAVLYVADLLGVIECDGILGEI